MTGGWAARVDDFGRPRGLPLLIVGQCSRPASRSEAFRGLRDKEMAELGEYRTERLVLEAYASLEWVR